MHRLGGRGKQFSCEIISVSAMSLIYTDYLSVTHVVHTEKKSTMEAVYIYKF